MEDLYQHLICELYPKLRTVRFEFHLHRKDMVRDTIHTTIIDSTYMAGVQALQNRDYKMADPTGPIQGLQYRCRVLCG